jgi:hypothetical protein
MSDKSVSDVHSSDFSDDLSSDSEGRASSQERGNPEGSSARTRDKNAAPVVEMDNKCLCLDIETASVVFDVQWHPTELQCALGLISGHVHILRMQWKVSVQHVCAVIMNDCGVWSHYATIHCIYWTHCRLIL